jgi:hypothetical protein
VICPGTIRFKAKKANSIPVGIGFSMLDELSVGAHLSKVERDLPEFRLLRNIILEHPVEMREPRFLSSLTEGEEAVFSWMVIYYLGSSADRSSSIKVAKISGSRVPVRGR